MNKEDYEKELDEAQEKASAMAMALMECNTICQNRLVDINIENIDKGVDSTFSINKLINEIGPIVMNEIMLSLMTHIQKLKGIIEIETGEEIIGNNSKQGTMVVNVDELSEKAHAELETLAHETLNDFMVAALMGMIEAAGEYGGTSKNLANVFNMLAEKRISNLPADDIADTYLGTLKED